MKIQAPGEPATGTCEDVRTCVTPGPDILAWLAESPLYSSYQPYSPAPDLIRTSTKEKTEMKRRTLLKNSAAGASCLTCQTIVSNRL